MSNLEEKKDTALVIKRLIAREVGRLLAVREAGFNIGDVQITWSPAKSVFEVQRPILGLFDAAKVLGSKTYIEKRLLVLCAGAYGEFTVVRREMEEAGSTFTGDEFWDCLKDDELCIYVGKVTTSEYIRACELATAYRSLISDGETPSEEELSDDSHWQVIHSLIMSLGFATASRLLTKPEFLSLVEGIVERDVIEDGTLRNGSICLGSADLAEYTPGGLTPDKNAVDASDMRIDGIQDDARVVPGAGLPFEVQRIFSHELGHWLTSKVLGMKVGDVEIDWLAHRGEPYPAGHATVFLGSASVTLGFERYLESRIAVLVAGSLAECGLRSPGRPALGDELYKTLYQGNGRDDFEKATELIIIHGANHLIGNHRQMPVGRELGGGHVLETVWGILRKLGISRLILSDQYRSFVNEVMEQLQGEGTCDWPFDNKFALKVPAAKISHMLALHVALKKLIEENVDEK